jgi:hypothetical protein
MRRTGLRLGSLAVIVAGLVAACGSSSTSSTSSTTSTRAPGSGLTVSPQRASPSSRVTFSFTPPRSAGARGAVELSYVISILGPHRTGCVGSHTASAPGAVRGEAAHVALGPTELGADWCAGAYTARAEEFERPVCKPGQECPMYIRLVGTVGTVAFRIAPSGG